LPPTIIAHRGASGYEYENSPSAFTRAKALGADGVELDVHATCDGGLIVHHDAELPEAGEIARLTTAEAVRYRLPNGERLPTLAEALVTLEGLDVWVEVKHLSTAHDADLVEALAAAPTPARYAVHSFDHRIVARLGRSRPALRRGALCASYLLDPVAVLRGCGADTLWQETHLVDRELVDLIHDAGLQIITWTTNTDAEVERVTRLGVDGVCGNYPDRARAVAEAGRS
jgi:glycerophosphoryl diester phosphodiesterase